MTSRADASLHLKPLSGHTAYSRQTYNSEPSYTSLDSGTDTAYNGATLDEPAHVASQTARKTEPPVQHPRNHIIAWWQEIVACIASFAALLALVATLYAYDDRPSPAWPKWITINTIISLYSGVLKAGTVLVVASGLGQLKWARFSGSEFQRLSELVIYDDASRGSPLGSLSLLWMLRQAGWLSSLGAVIAILVLATDPFVQQIVHYYDCSTPIANIHASLPRTNFYFEPGGYHVSAGEEQIIPEVQSAINAGLFNPKSSPEVQCHTGNCTWPQEYTSLAWCSSCTDISSELSIKNLTWVYGNGVVNMTTWNMSTSLPSGLKVEVPWGYDGTWAFASVGMSSSPGYKDFSLVADVEFILGKLPPLPDTGKEVVNPSTGAPFPDCITAVENSTLWKCRGYGASRCSLYPCVKTYSAFVQTGLLTETLINSTDRWGAVSSASVSAMLDTTCISLSERQSLQKEGYQLRNGERWLAYNMSFPMSTWKLDDTFPDSMLKRDCIYAIDATFQESLSVWFGTFFSGQVNGGQLDVPGAAIGEFSGPQALQALFNFGDITFNRMEDAFTNISTSLTNYIRENGAANFSAAATGVVNQEKTCIAVQWPWLAFPAVLVLLTSCFLVALLLKTRPGRDQPEIWKTSPLALLCHGLLDSDGTTRMTSGGLPNNRGAMEALAGRMKVRLSSVGGSAVGLEIESEKTDADESRSIEQ